MSVKHLCHDLLLFTKHHSSVMLGVFFSLLIHVGFIAFWPHTKPHEVSDSHTFFKNIDVTITSSTSSVLRQPTLDKKASKSVAERKSQKNAQQVYGVPDAADEVENQKIAFSGYLSPSQVEIQALPITNIDASMLSQKVSNSDLQQNLPLQFRLYIDELGHVIHIEKIAMVLAQDAALADALENLLKDVQFTPAKNHYVEVKSYQDIAFDFKAAY